MQCPRIHLRERLWLYSPEKLDIPSRTARGYCSQAWLILHPVGLHRAPSFQLICWIDAARPRLALRMVDTPQDHFLGPVRDAGCD
jgi:hypothetical protein